MWHIYSSSSRMVKMVSYVICSHSSCVQHCKDNKLICIQRKVRMSTTQVQLYTSCNILHLLWKCCQSIYHYWWSLFTVRKRSLWQGNIFIGMCQSFYLWGGSLCMMSLPVWLPGPIFLLGRRVLCARSLVPSGGLCFWSHVPSKGFPSRGSLSRGSVPDRDPPWTEGVCPGRVSVRETHGQKPPIQ